jgi:hypothetical protein
VPQFASGGNTNHFTLYREIMTVCSHFVGKMYSFGVKSGGVYSKRRLLKGFKKRVLIYIAPALPLRKSALRSDDVFVRVT